MQDFKNLVVWQKAHALTLEIYKITKLYPPDERFGLISQMRRSGASVPTNIAEGCVRSSDADFARFLHVSLGSISELEYQLLLSRELNYLEQTKWQKLNNHTNEVKRMLIAFITKLGSKL